MKVVKALTCLLLLCLGFQSAWAQSGGTNDLGTITVTGSRPRVNTISYDQLMVILGQPQPLETEYRVMDGVVVETTFLARMRRRNSSKAVVRSTGIRKVIH